MQAVRLVAGILLVVASCEDDKHPEQTAEHAEHEAAREQAEATCVKLFEKIASCRDDMLMLARMGPVLRGDPPDIAFASAKPLEQSMSGALESKCAEGVPAGIAKGLECYDEDCRALASCMMQHVSYPNAAAGNDALVCRDGLPAFVASGQGKVLQWCVMPDGTPHGLYRITDDKGTLLVEGTYDRGRSRGDKTATPGKKWWD